MSAEEFGGAPRRRRDNPRAASSHEAAGRAVNSLSANDPKYEAVRTRFIRRKIPLELMDYALGLAPVPRADTPSAYTAEHDKHISDLLEKHHDSIATALTLAYKGHIEHLKKNPGYASTWEDSNQAWKQMDEERVLSALPAELHEYVTGKKPIPDDEEGAKIKEAIELAHARPFAVVPASLDDSRETKDLPPMPKDIRDRIQQFPAAVNYAIIMFTRQLREGGFNNGLQDKFAHYFSDEVEEKAFRQNPNARDRTRYENAYWALLSLKIAHEHGHSGKRKYPEFRFDTFETSKQIEQFLTFEKISRLERELQKADGARADAIRTEIDTLRQSPIYTNTRQEFYDGNVPKEALEDPHTFENSRLPTIIEALGNRLYVGVRNIPIDEDTITKVLEDKGAATDDAEGTSRLSGDLRWKQRLIGRQFATSSLEIASSSRDVDTMAEFLLNSGVWDESAQEGFDMLMRSISNSARESSRIKDLVRSALDTPDIPDHATELFKSHEKNLHALERTMRAAQTKLLLLWHEYNGDNKGDRLKKAEAQRAKELEAEISKHLDRIKLLEGESAALSSKVDTLAVESDLSLTSLEVLRDKLREVAKNTSDARAKDWINDALVDIDEFLALPSEARDHMRQ